MQAFRKKFIVVVAVAALLAACAPGQSPEQIQGQVETSVAATVDAENQMGTAVALTVAAQAPAPTETLTPTTIPLDIPTLTPILDTSTPFTVVPPSGGGGGGGGSNPSVKKQKYLCTIVNQVPGDGSRATILKVGDTLDVRWTFRNDGTITWDPTWTWEFYSSQIDTNVGSNYGLTMSSTGSQHSLGATVQKTQAITLGVSLTAPNFEGRDPIHIGTAWSIIGDGVKFCIADINVEIIRPGMTP